MPERAAEPRGAVLLRDTRACVTEAITNAEWHAAIDMLGAVAHGKRATVGAGRGYGYPRL
ncbi:MAG TPA: hypothetical protein VFB14_01735 [Bryobacteraceae bacterium]|nr:hypothetical protein [Bryobacteraceae bacterium]